MQELHFRAMGCQMLAILDAPGSAHAARLAAVPGWFATWEQHLSRFRDDSELMQLNRSAGRPTRVSAVLWSVLQAARQAAHWSKGLVVPTLLDALEGAGYTHSLDAPAASRAPQARLDHQRLPHWNWRAIRCQRRTRVVRLPPGMRLDLNGVAKSWAAERALQRLAPYGPALVNAGGDLAISRPQHDGSPWPISVAAPGRDDSDVALLLVPQGGIATSGRDQRTWRQGEAVQHHLLDPHTNRCARTDLLTVTIIAPTLHLADVAAKVVMLRGSRAGLAWLEGQAQLAGVLICADGHVIPSQRVKQFLWNA